MAHRRATIRTAAAAGVAVAAALGVSACGGSAGDEESVTFSDLQEGTADLTEEAFTVSAAIGDVYSGHAFTLTGDDGGDPVLVVSPDDVVGITPELAARVTGVVQEGLDVPAVEEDEGVDLDDDALADWAGRPYVLAEEVDLFETDDEQ
ncbi:hypothetical protein ACI8AC_08550 [Geodermatophilus sp. SYSU D00758]